MEILKYWKNISLIMIKVDINSLYCTNWTKYSTETRTHWLNFYPFSLIFDEYTSQFWSCSTLQYLLRIYFREIIKINNKWQKLFVITLPFLGKTPITKVVLWPNFGFNCLLRKFDQNSASKSQPKICLENAFPSTE